MPPLGNLLPQLEVHRGQSGSRVHVVKCERRDVIRVEANVRQQQRAAYHRGTAAPCSRR